MCFLVGFLLFIDMHTERLEQLKANREKEAKRFYEDYHVELDKESNPIYYPVYPYFSSNEEIETKTVKLSNSTTPMACY